MLPTPLRASRQEGIPQAQVPSLVIFTRTSLLLFVTLAFVAPTALAQANVQGQWATLNTQMPINPVHLALMHNGKVLVVSGSGNLPSDTTYLGAVWDPTTDTVTTQPVPFDMFCNGMVVLPDGRPFIMSGTQQYDPFHGDPRTAAYDPASGNFVQLQSMADGRWYPTATTLSDGSVMIFSGLDQQGNTNTTVEIYKVGVGWSQPYGAGWTPPLYPRMHLLPNGTVFYSGSTTSSAIFNPTTHAWQTGAATTNYSGTRTYGSSVLLPLLPSNNYKPVVIIMGGGSPATNTTELIDLSASNPKWVYGPNMSQPRIEMDAVILPNGKVLAVNGSTYDEDATTASLNADLYDPFGNKFSSAGANAFPRLYHSGALLLPDATVMVVGGNPQRGTYEPHVEIYSPAYLFNANGTLATRPAISSVTPGVIGYASSFQVQTPNASSISSVVLVRAGSPTHAFDMDQRLVGLNFTAGSGVLNATAPPNGSVAPPGYYLLFILNSSGVPSVAQFVQLSPAPTDQPPTGIITSPANDLTIAAGQSVSFAGTGTSQSGTIAAYSWAFPGGNPASSTVANPGAVTYSTAGTYVASLTVTDNSGVTDPSPPTRTVTVTGGQAAPAITSANNTTFSAGTAESFTVTATGSPTPSLSETGALPSGVTFKDNGNGTGTLSGTPASGTAGNYPLTFTASNGVGTAASQSFTLTVGNFAYVSGSVTGVVNGTGSSTTLSVTLHQNPGAGHLLLCAATWQSSTATASMSDPNNGTWKSVGSPKTGIGSLSPFRGQIFYVPSAVSASTPVTLTISSAVQFRAFECAEYSYSGTISSLDGTPQYSTTPASGGVATISGLTTSNSSDLVFVDCLGVDTTCTAGSGYTGLNDNNTYDAASGSFGASFWGITGQMIEHKVGVAAGAQSATFGTGTATDNVILGLLAMTANQLNQPLTSIAPASAMVGGAAFTLTLTGTGFATGATVNFGSNPAITPSSVTSTQIVATIPAADIAEAGTVNVTVTDPAPGGTSNAQTFTINNPAPTETSLSPISATAGGAAFTLTVNGTGFVSTSVVKFNGAAKTTTFVNATQLTAAITAADIATAGTATVTVTNPAPGGTSNAVSFAINNAVPTIGSLSPSSAVAGSAAFTLTVNGVGFVSGATVNFNGAPKGTIFVSNTQITAAILASDIATTGTANVTVTNPAPALGPSGAQVFTISSPNSPAPTISSLGPTHASGGAAFTLTINGVNFEAKSLVNLNGKPEQTTFISATQISAAVPASDVATAGNVNVTVTNPPPGGGTSSASIFTVDGYSLGGPSGASLTSGQPAMIQIIATPTANGFTNSISFSVVGLPAGATASFNPAMLTLNGVAKPTMLTITNGSLAAAQRSAGVSGSVRPLQPLLATLFVMTIGWLYLRLQVRATPFMKRYTALALFALILLTGSLLGGCALGVNSPSVNTSQLSVMATSGTLTQTFGITLQVTR